MMAIDFVKFNREKASNTTTAMIDRAARIASTSQMRHKHGAVATLGGSVIAVGVNVKKNAPLPYVPYDYLSTHAEINTLSGVNRMAGVILYVVRVNAAGNILDSKPCVKCEEYLHKWTNVKRVIYT